MVGKKRKAAKSKKAQEGLAQAAKEWNQKSQAQKKAERKWGNNKDGRN